MILTTRDSNYNHTVAISNQTSTYAKKRVRRSYSLLYTVPCGSKTLTFAAVAGTFMLKLLHVVRHSAFLHSGGIW